MASVQSEAIFYNHYYFLQAFINALKIFSDSSNVSEYFSSLSSLLFTYPQKKYIIILDGNFRS